MSKPEQIILRGPERIWESIARDVVSVGALLAAVGVGIWLDSSALQWIAAIVWILWIFGKAATLGKAISIQEARKRLDEIEAGNG